MSTDVAFFETTALSIPFTVTSQGEEEDLLVCTLASPIVSPEHASILAQDSYHSGLHLAPTPPSSSPLPAASMSDPILSDDLPIAICKGKS